MSGNNYDHRGATKAIKAGLVIVMFVVLVLCVFVAIEMLRVLPEARYLKPSERSYPQTVTDLAELGLFKSNKSWLERRWYLSSQGARLIIDRKREDDVNAFTRDWHYNFTIISIWVFANWSKEDVITTYLSERRYGRKYIGLDDAAEAFYGLSVDQLSYHEVAVLVMNLKSNSKYDPFCNGEYVRFGAQKLVQLYKTEIKTQDPSDTIELFRLKAGAYLCP